jgi:hypothetical protein
MLFYLLGIISSLAHEEVGAPNQDSETPRWAYLGNRIPGPSRIPYIPLLGQARRETLIQV